MKALCAIALTLIAGAAQAADPEFSGQIRPEWLAQPTATQGPLALADAIAPGTAAPPGTGLIVQSELHARAGAFTAIATLQQQSLEGTGFLDQGWFNEAYGSIGRGGWQFAAGKKIVGWDVGYGFRPNDVVEQETRRTLLTTTPVGRPLAMAEYFDAGTAWSFVLVNIGHGRDERGADEPALAARAYSRIGTLDAFGFARWGERTGASLGLAGAWVANESLELHASWRAMRSADTLAIAPAATGLVTTNPWQPASTGAVSQWLVGATWTNADQISLMAEAWWDGTALSDAQWADWGARNGRIQAFLATPAPRAAIAGNLAWQAQAFDASTNLRRSNLYVRASWTYDAWQPAIDCLYNPADGGRVATASLGWQGDRWRFDGGARLYGGPSSAVMAQLPTRSVFFAAATWAF